MVSDWTFSNGPGISASAIGITALVARRQDRGNLGLTAWSKKGYYEQTKNFSAALALASGQRLQATSRKLQASSRKLDKKEL
jgi:hypothetical protein